MPIEARLFLCLLVSYENTETKQLKVAEIGAIVEQIHLLLLMVPRQDMYTEVLLTISPTTFSHEESCMG